MKSKASWLVVTDLDGTLMDDNYDISPAFNTLRWLKNKNIPVIPCTSKTASEVESFREMYNLHDPYIVENGGAIYGEKNDSREKWEIIIGRSYEDLRPFLDLLGEYIGKIFLEVKKRPRYIIRNALGISDIKNKDLFDSNDENDKN